MDKKFLLEFLLDENPSESLFSARRLRNKNMLASFSRVQRFNAALVVLKI